MTDNQANIRQTIATLLNFKPGAPLKNYIGFVRFPNFKNMERDALIEFDFPLTVLVGANGIGKSSVLHALFGMPEGQSTARFWFSTDLDPIRDDIEKDPSRYVYGHWHEGFGGYVQTRKARVSKPDRLDYWEPTKRTAGDKMPPMPAKKYVGKSKDRWNPVQRKVLYINLKCELGSFDKYFYFDTGRTLEQTHVDMRREARRLKRIVDGDLNTFPLFGHEKLLSNRSMNADELAQVGQILGRSYSSARLVRHRLYPGNRGEDVSVIFSRAFSYSEAFAGSGEVAIASAVSKILTAEKNTLILLDEPETSLHPGAQRRFLNFLLEQVKKKHHQIVLSTHSPEFVESLPPQAIKVFEETPDGKIRILPSSTPFAAFQRLEKLAAGRKRILVEDGLARRVILAAASQMDPGDGAALDILVVPGGADAILKYYIPAALATKEDTYIFLDGDKRCVDSFTEENSVPQGINDHLETIITAELGLMPKLFLDGGGDTHGNAAKTFAAQRALLQWVGKRLHYLPKVCPDRIVLDCLDGAEAALVVPTPTAEEAKTLLRQILGLPNGSASDIEAIAGYKLHKAASTSPDLAAVRSVLLQIIALHQH